MIVTAHQRQEAVHVLRTEPVRTAFEPAARRLGLDQLDQAGLELAGAVHDALELAIVEPVATQAHIERHRDAGSMAEIDAPNQGVPGSFRLHEGIERGRVGGVQREHHRGQIEALEFLQPFERHAVAGAVDPDFRPAINGGAYLGIVLPVQFSPDLLFCLFSFLPDITGIPYIDSLLLHLQLLQPIPDIWYNAMFGFLSILLKYGFL